MAEIWGAAIMVGGSLLSGMGASAKDKKDKKHDKEMIGEQARWDAALSAYNFEQTDYYNQLNRKRKERGLDNFRSFSQVSSFAPQYAQASPGIEVPDKPVFSGPGAAPAATPPATTTPAPIPMAKPIPTKPLEMT